MTAGLWISRVHLAQSQSPESSARVTALVSAPPGIRQISLATKDLVYDPVGQRMYASVPASAPNGNSLTQIDPFLGTIGVSVFMGTEPGRLAISDNSQYIYASLDGAAAVRRFDIASQSASLQFPLGSDNTWGAYYVNDLEVLPGQADSIAVSRKYLNSTANAGLAVYDNGLPRPNRPDANSENPVIVFSSSASTLYGLNNRTTEFGFRKMAVNSSGVTIVTSTGNLIPGFGADIRFANGLIYSSNGRVINPETATRVGSFPGIGDGSLVVPDPGSNRVYFLTGSGSSTLTLKAFDLTTFIQTGSLSIPGVSGTPGSFIKWADDGLAFRTTGNQIFFLSTADIVPVTATATPTPANVGGITRLPLATNDIVYDPNTQKVYASLPSTSGTFGNSIAAINPQTGAMSNPVFIGSEPRRLAISDNGEYIYAALDGAASIRRFEVAPQTAGLQFALGISHPHGPMTPGDIAVMPGNAHAIAVARRNTGNFTDSVGVYDDGVVRSNSVLGGNAIEFSSSAASLYGYGQTGSFYKMAVSASGVSMTSVIGFLLAGSGVDIRYDSGRLYSTNGRVIDPEAETLIATLDGVSGLVVPDVASGQIFYLTGLGSSTLTLRSYNSTTHALIGTATISSVSGTPGSFIKAGANLLAFRTESQVYFIPTNLITPIPEPTPTQVDTGIIRLPLAARDIVYDSITQKVYASVPGNAGSFGNSLVPIDPMTGTMSTPIFLGSEPGRLAISGNNQYIYAALNGNGGVRRFDLGSQTAGLEFSLGVGPFGGRFYVDDMGVVPGDANAVAISRRNLNTSPRFEGVAIYDTGIPRPTIITNNNLTEVIEFAPWPSTLYGYNNESTGFDYRKMLVNAAGVSIVTNPTSGLGGFNLDLKYDNGRIYASNGRVINAESGATVGTFSGASSLAFVPDGSVKRTYFVAGTGGPTTLQAFDQNTFSVVGVLGISSVSGTPLKMIRWGANGLAFITSGNEIYFIQDSSLVPPASVSPSSTSLTSSANPINFGQSVTFTATVSTVSDAPTGTVQFQDNGVNLGAPQSLSGGVATLQTSALTAGQHVISAVYSGDANFLMSGATLAGGQSVLPLLSINDVSITEGNAGTKTVTFTITLSAASNQTVSINYASADGTATLADNDYQSASGTLNFSPGTLTRTFNVTLTGDQKFETDETLLINLTSPANAVIADSQGVGTIVNDDTLQLLFDPSGPAANQSAAVDSLLYLRDPFRVQTLAEWLVLGSDRNTRVLVFVRNLQPNQGPPTTVNLIDGSGNSFNVTVEDVRAVPATDITQVRFRLPDTLAAGLCQVTVRKTNGQVTNTGTFRVSQ